MKACAQLRRAAGLVAVLVGLVPLVLAGCSGGDKGVGTVPADGTVPTKAQPAEGHDAEVRAEREKLSPEDRTLVDAQEWCAVSTDSRLGSMGLPLKLAIKDQPVFVCCEGCQKKALADPDKTLATVADLKARAKVEREKQ